MVPCPAEHEAQLRQAVMHMSMGATGWTEAIMRRHLASVPPEQRALIEAVARVAVDYGRLGYRDASNRLGIDVGEVLDLVTQVNRGCQLASVPMMLITDIDVKADADGGEEARPVLGMVRPVAQLVLAVRARSKPSP